MEDSDGDGLADDYGNCFQPGLPLPEAVDSIEPPVGFMQVYWFTGEDPNGEGPLGSTSGGLPRPNRAPCP